MNRIIMSLALVAAFALAVPAQAQFTQFGEGEWDAAISQFMEWRTTGWGGNEEHVADYASDAKVEALLTLYKDGAQNAANGKVNVWSSNPDAWWLEEGATVSGKTTWWVNIYGPAYEEQGLVAPNIYDLGFALTGCIGSQGAVIMGTTGMRANISLEIPGMGTFTLAAALSGLTNFMGDLPPIEYQTYLNGAVVNVAAGPPAPPAANIAVNNANDKQITFVWSPLITELLGGGGDISEAISSGDAGIVINSALRNQNGLSIIAVTGDPAPIPEPATLAIMGLGLAGLGIARRRMKK